MDPVAEWSAAKGRVSDLVRGADPDVVVPACPDWTVRQLLSHMVGLGVDVVAGDEPDDHNDAWTQRQVDQRADASIADLLSEWDGVTEAMLAYLRDTSPRPLGDVIIHEQDLRGALGVPGGRDTAGLRAIRDRMLGRFAANLEGKPPLRLDAGDWTWSSGDGEPAAVITASEFDLARAIVSRRSAAQLRSWTRSGDVEPYLACFEVLGSLPERDLTD